MINTVVQSKKLFISSSNFYVTIHHWRNQTVNSREYLEARNETEKIEQYRLWFVKLRLLYSPGQDDLVHSRVSLPSSISDVLKQTTVIYKIPQ